MPNQPKNPIYPIRLHQHDKDAADAIRERYGTLNRAGAIRLAVRVVNASAMSYEEVKDLLALYEEVTENVVSIPMDITPIRDN